MTTPPADGMPTTRGTNLLPRRFQPRLRPVADALYHALAGAWLLAEGQALWHERQSARKLVAGAPYVRK
jgi:hypothetical protein